MVAKNSDGKYYKKIKEFNMRNINIKSILSLIAICLPLLAQENSLELKCFSIPKSKKELCTSQTINAYIPYEDTTFYLKKEGDFYFIDVFLADMTSFGSFDFSDGGKYMYISFSEEGHEYFVFYKTKEFLSQGHKAKSLAILNEYNFKEFSHFEDSGKVSYFMYTKEKEQVMYF